MPSETTTESLPAEFIDLSRRVGQDALLTQGAGGNTSWKAADGQLWVKASGRWLAEADAAGTFVPVSADLLRQAVADSDDAGVRSALKHGGDAGDARPSMETVLHVVMPHRVVMHIHSVNLLAWAVRADGRDRLGERLDGLRWSWVPYAMPGPALGMAAADHRDPDADVLVLANHGVVLGADSCDEAWALLSDIEQRVRIQPRDTAADPERLRGVVPGWAPAPEIAVHAMATDPVSRAVAAGPPLFPDQVVFLGPNPPLVMTLDDFRQGGPSHPVPPYVVVQDAGVAVAEEITPGASAALLALALTAARLDRDAPLAALTAGDIGTLTASESERYRQALDR